MYFVKSAISKRSLVASSFLRTSSIWASVPQGPPDPVFGVAEAYKLDKNPKKVNLSVGAYRTNEGKPWVLDSVIKAEKAMLAEGLNKEYAPIAGLSDFCDAAVKLAFGADSAVIAKKQNATIQTLSGTGALQIGASFLKKFYTGVHEIYLPEPTWPNHHNVFRTNDIAIKTYNYYCPETRGYDENRMMESIKKMPKHSIILLHACAHNPTGVDPTHDQWKRLSAAIKKQHVLSFFDMAYQGFASGSLDKDAFAVRLFFEDGHPLMLAQSFAKNMGLYGERVGAFTAICQDAAQAKIVISQLKRIVRPMYSNPPLHGARIACKIMNTPELQSQWYDELKVMSGRIFKMRELLVENLKAAGSKMNLDHVTNQIGMFCFTGLTPDQVDKMTSEYSIYMTKDGRISIPGLTTENVKYVANAMHKVTQ